MSSSSTIDLISISDVLQKQDERISQNNQSFDLKVTQLQDTLEKVQQQIKRITEADVEINQDFRSNKNSLLLNPPKGGVVHYQSPQQNRLSVLNHAFEGDEEKDERAGSLENG